jgi:hypothetical protein
MSSQQDIVARIGGRLQRGLVHRLILVVRIRKRNVSGNDLSRELVISLWLVYVVEIRRAKASSVTQMKRFRLVAEVIRSDQLILWVLRPRKAPRLYPAIER